MPTSVVNQFPSSNSPSSIMLPHTPKLAKLLHPLSSRCSQSVRSITPVVSSVFRKSSRCATSGPNSHNPPAYRVCNLGPFSSLSSSPGYVTPRTEGPSAPARPEHTKNSAFHFSSFLAFRRSIALLLRQVPRRFVVNLIFRRMTFVPPIFRIVAHSHIRLLLNFFVWTLLTIPAPTHLLYCMYQ